MKSGSTTVSLSSGCEMSTIFEGSFIVESSFGAAPCAQAARRSRGREILLR